jgi:tetratricopeptide (TPR) repeat protein
MQNLPAEASDGLVSDGMTKTSDAADAGFGSDTRSQSHVRLKGLLRDFGRIFKKVTSWRRIAAGLALAIPILAGGYVVIVSLTHNTITIEPLSTPKSLADDGYTPEVAAAHFRAALERALAQTLAPGPQLAVRAEQPDIVVPSLGVSAQAIANSIRKFLPMSKPPILSGEFTLAEGQLRLTIRSGGRNIYSSPRGVSPDKIRQLMDAAAPPVLQQVWPIYFVLVSARRNPIRALDAADQIISASSHWSPETSMAYLLKGMIYIDRKQYRRAVASFTSLLKLETRPNQRLEVYVGRALAYQRSNRVKEAGEDMMKAEEIAAGIPSGSIMLHLAKNEPFAAAAEIRRVAKKNILSPGSYTQAGAFFSLLKMTKEAMEIYEEAIRLDPDDIAAHLNLANGLHPVPQTPS